MALICGATCCKCQLIQSALVAESKVFSNQFASRSALKLRRRSRRSQTTTRNQIAVGQHFCAAAKCSSVSVGVTYYHFGELQWTLYLLARRDCQLIKESRSGWLHCTALHSYRLHLGQQRIIGRLEAASISHSIRLHLHHLLL